MGKVFVECRSGSDRDRLVDELGYHGYTVELLTPRAVDVQGATAADVRAACQRAGVTPYEVHQMGYRLGDGLAMAQDLKRGDRVRIESSGETGRVRDVEAGGRHVVVDEDSGYSTRLAADDVVKMAQPTKCKRCKGTGSISAGGEPLQCPACGGTGVVKMDLTEVSVGADGSVDVAVDPEGDEAREGLMEMGWSPDSFAEGDRVRVEVPGRGASEGVVTAKGNGGMRVQFKSGADFIHPVNQPYLKVTKMDGLLMDAQMDTRPAGQAVTIGKTKGGRDVKVARSGDGTYIAYVESANGSRLIGQGFNSEAEARAVAKRNADSQDFDSAGHVDSREDEVKMARSAGCPYCRKTVAMSGGVLGHHRAPGGECDGAGRAVQSLGQGGVAVFGTARTFPASASSRDLSRGMRVKVNGFDPVMVVQKVDSYGVTVRREGGGGDSYVVEATRVSEIL